MKTTMSEMKSTLNCMNSRLAIAEENRGLKDMAIEIIKMKQ